MADHSNDQYTSQLTLSMHSNGKANSRLSPTYSTVSSSADSVFYPDPYAPSPVPSVASNGSGDNLDGSGGGGGGLRSFTNSRKRIASKADIYRQKLANHEPITKDMEQVILRGERKE